MNKYAGLINYYKLRLASIEDVDTLDDISEKLIRAINDNFTGIRSKLPFSRKQNIIGIIKKLKSKYNKKMISMRINKFRGSKLDKYGNPPADTIDVDGSIAKTQFEILKEISKEFLIEAEKELEKFGIEIDNELISSVSKQPNTVSTETKITYSDFEKFLTHMVYAQGFDTFSNISKKEKDFDGKSEKFIRISNSILLNKYKTYFNRVLNNQEFRFHVTKIDRGSPIYSITKKPKELIDYLDSGSVEGTNSNNHGDNVKLINGVISNVINMMYGRNSWDSFAEAINEIGLNPVEPVELFKEEIEKLINLAKENDAGTENNYNDIITDYYIYNTIRAKKSIPLKDKAVELYQNDILPKFKEWYNTIGKGIKGFSYKNLHPDNLKKLSGVMGEGNNGSMLTVIGAIRESDKHDEVGTLFDFSVPSKSKFRSLSGPTTKYSEILDVQQT